mmetsp:Transcript_125711/g.363672  ORF Transcript_125711/g.363672 Transcript_125711/m.363672 type:complete len:334 (-) Transcript_125711:490-1491(-)
MITWSWSRSNNLKKWRSCFKPVIAGHSTPKRRTPSANSWWLMLPLPFRSKKRKACLALPAFLIILLRMTSRRNLANSVRSSFGRSASLLPATARRSFAKSPASSSEPLSSPCSATSARNLTALCGAALAGAAVAWETAGAMPRSAACAASSGRNVADGSKSSALRPASLPSDNSVPSLPEVWSICSASPPASSADAISPTSGAPSSQSRPSAASSPALSAAIGSGISFSERPRAGKWPGDLPPDLPPEELANEGFRGPKSFSTAVVGSAAGIITAGDVGRSAKAHGTATASANTAQAAGTAEPSGAAPVLRDATSTSPPSSPRNLAISFSIAA